MCNYQMHKDRIIEIAKAHGADNVRIIKEETDRLDFLMDFVSGSSLLDLIAVKQELEDLLSFPVLVLTENSIHPFMREEVLKNASIL